MLWIVAPETNAHISVLFLLGLGAAVGILGGFFGVGGGWMITPLLNMLGLPVKHAVGTGLGYILGMSSISAFKHRRRGNLETRLGVMIGSAMLVGLKGGKMVMGVLDRAGQAEPVVRGIYVVLLLSLGTFMLVHTLKLRRGGQAETADEATDNVPLLQRFSVKPCVVLPRSGITLSLWPAACIGLVAGFLSGILGVGGGFMLMPVMVYLIGMPTVLAVGTSLMCLLIASPFGVLLYAANGWVLYRAAAVMIVGALVGSPIGVRASHKVHGHGLRLLYAITIITGGFSVLLMELGERFPGTPCNMLSRALLLSAVGGMALLVLILMGLADWRGRGPDDGPDAHRP